MLTSKSLENFYSRCNPDLVEKASHIASKWKGQEDKLCERLWMKYGTRPKIIDDTVDDLGRKNADHKKRHRVSRQSRIQRMTPSMPPPFVEEMVVALDLDETLVHSVDASKDNFCPVGGARILESFEVCTKFGEHLRV